MIEQIILRKAQLIMLDTLLELDRICKKYNINYWITDGTFLGAIRHRGFIPWDDDIDICMLENDYCKFLEIVKKELKTSFFFQEISTDKYCDCSWARIKDRNNYGISQVDNRSHLGLGIDIFPMISYSTISKKRYNFLFKLKDVSYQKNEINFIKKFLKKMIILFKVNNIAFKILNLYKNEVSKNIGYKYSFPQLYHYDAVFPLSEIEFEGYKFPCPNNADAYLKELYGETYMKLPAKENRISHFKEIKLNEKCFFEKELERTGRSLYEEE